MPSRRNLLQLFGLGGDNAKPPKPNADAFAAAQDALGKLIPDMDRRGFLGMAASFLAAATKPEGVVGILTNATKLASKEGLYALASAHRDAYLAVVAEFGKDIMASGITIPGVDRGQRAGFPDFFSARLLELDVVANDGHEGTREYQKNPAYAAIIKRIQASPAGQRLQELSRAFSNHPLIPEVDFGDLYQKTFNNGDFMDSLGRIHDAITKTSRESPSNGANERNTPTSQNEETLSDQAIRWARQVGERPSAYPGFAERLEQSYSPDPQEPDSWPRR